MSQVIIVGAGLFGSMAATLARRAGHQVTVIDCTKPLAASKCAAGLMKRTWMSGLDPAQVKGGYAVLHQLYGVAALAFSACPRPVELEWVNPRAVLLKPDLQGEVTAVGDGAVWVGSKVLRGKVLVAAGAYSERLVRMPKTRWLIGPSLHFAGKAEPQYHVYAPYRQAMAFNIGLKEIWAGDGCAVLHWDEGKRIAQLRQRAKEFFGLRGDREVRIGARPYVEGYKGYFARAHSNTWVSTGGAKNGTILAAYQAQRFVDEL
jgi:glycine/D-amino acid oxidase-like deaminating enzyme